MATNRWIYLLAGFLINLMLGVIYSWSVFIGPLESIFGWTRAMSSGAFTLVVAFFAPGMLIGGLLLGKWGPRKVVWVGGILLAAGAALKFPPEGWVPEGWTPPKPTEASEQAKVHVAHKDYEWREMIRTKQFWMLWFWYWFIAAAGLLTIGHMKVVAKEYGADVPMMGTTAGVIAVGMLSLFNGLGRPGFGGLSDKIGRRKALMLDAALMTIM